MKRNSVRDSYFGKFWRLFIWCNRLGLSDYKVRLVTRLQWVRWLVLCQVFRNVGLNRLIECYACQELFIESWPCHLI